MSTLLNGMSIPSGDRLRTPVFSATCEVMHSPLALPGRAGSPVSANVRTKEESMRRCSFVAVTVASTVCAAGYGLIAAQGRPAIPRTWDDQEIARHEVPLAD